MNYNSLCCIIHTCINYIIRDYIPILYIYDFAARFGNVAKPYSQRNRLRGMMSEQVSAYRDASAPAAANHTQGLFVINCYSLLYNDQNVIIQ